MPTLCLADLLVVLLWHAAFPGCLHSFLAPSSLTFLLQQEICCNGHFLLPSLGLLRHHFFRCQLLSLFVDHIPVLALASVISGRNNFSSLASSIRAYPHPAHKPSFTVRRLTSTFISHKQAPLLFSPQAWEELLIKKNCSALSLSSSPFFNKDFLLCRAGPNLAIVLLDLLPTRMVKIALCSLMHTISGSSFSHLCGKQGLCFHALSNTMGIPSLWQPPVTHCIGACLGRRRGREGKVHRVFKKLLSLPLNTFFDTPQHRPSRGTQCKPPGPLPQPPPAISRGVLQPGFLQECRELHRMLSDIALQSETEGVLLSGKPKSASKNWEFGWYPAPSVQLCFSHCPAVSFPLGWVVGKVRFLPSPRALLFQTAPCFAVGCVLPPLCDYP